MKKIYIEYSKKNRDLDCIGRFDYYINDKKVTLLQFYKSDENIILDKAFYFFLNQCMNELSFRDRIDIIKLNHIQQLLYFAQNKIKPDFSDSKYYYFIAPLSYIDPIEGALNDNNIIEPDLDTSETIETKKDLIKMMLKKYNKSKIKVVKKIKEEDKGMLSKRDIKIVFNIDNDFLIIEDILTIDNISLYYEFMSSDNLQKYSFLVWIAICDRVQIIEDKLVLHDVIYKNDNDIILFDRVNGFKAGISFFGIKDTLKPIDGYISEIKESEIYKNYLVKK